MKVWIVFGEIFYEERRVLDVFATQEAAEKFAAEDVKVGRWELGAWDAVSVEEFLVKGG